MQGYFQASQISALKDFHTGFFYGFSALKRRIALGIVILKKGFDVAVRVLD